MEFLFTGHFLWQWIESNTTQTLVLQVCNLIGVYIIFTVSGRNLKIMILGKAD